MLFERPEKPAVLNRVRIPRPGYRDRFLFGVLVPHTNGTVICDGRARRIIQVDGKLVEHA